VLLGKRRGGDEKDRGPLTPGWKSNFTGNVPYDAGRDILLADGKEAGRRNSSCNIASAGRDSMTVSRIFLARSCNAPSAMTIAGRQFDAEDFYAFAASSSA